jgi:hypothetical protein
MLQSIARHTPEEARELRGLFEKQLRELYWTETTVAGMLNDMTWLRLLTKTGLKQHCR